MAPGDSRRPARLSVAVATPDSQRGAIRGLATWLANAAPSRARGEVALALVSDARMRALNRAYRGMDYATDVLSFPASPPQTKGSTVRTKSGRAGHDVRTAEALASTGPFLGDIVIASGVATRQARTVGHSVQTELKVLALHGLLHLLGFDHERDNGEMARAEARLRRKAGLRDGLIERDRDGSRQSAVGSPAVGSPAIGSQTKRSRMPAARRTTAARLPTADSRLPSRSRQ